MEEKLGFKKAIGVLIKTIKLLLSTSKSSFFVITFFSVFSGLIIPLNMWTLKLFIDSLTHTLSSGEFNSEIVICLLLICGVQLASTIFSIVNNLTRENFSSKLALEINTRILDKCVELPMKEYDDEKNYNMIQFAAEQTPSKCSSLIDVFSSIIQNIITLISAIGIVLLLNTGLLFVCILSSIPLFFINKYISSYWYKIFVKRMEKMRFIDTIKGIILKNDNIKELKLFDIANFLKKRILKQQTTFYNEDRKSRNKFSWLSFFQAVISNIITISLKIWIIAISLGSKYSLGTTNMFMSAVDQLGGSVSSLCSQISSVYAHAQYINSLFSVLELQVPEEKNLAQLVDEIKSVEFVNVSFQYPYTNKNVLNNLSFLLERNKTYAFIGINGAGKTTMLKLMMKLYLPTSGKILINGIDIKQLNSKSIHKNISAIFQDFIKFPFTINDNIAFSDIESLDDTKRIKSAAVYSGASAFIDKYPLKYNTQLQKEWADGTELSLGQWQKLAISRCIFKNSSTMIFDEAFSSLDAISEKQIIDRLKTTKTNKICIFITHRYSSLSLADKIFVLKDGVLVEEGVHKQLITRKGYYNELFKAQSDPMNELNQ